MKKNDLFIIIATIAYSYLFYQQAAGINFLLFNLLLILLLSLQQPAVIKNLPWKCAAAGSIISSFLVCWWGTDLPVFANFTSVLMLIGFSYETESSLLVAVANTCFSLAISFLAAPFKTYIPKTGNEKPENGIFKMTGLIIIPLIVVLIFFLLYRESNPVFEKLTDQINLDFISPGWVLFTGFGFILLFGVFRYVGLETLVQADAAANDSLKNISLEDHLQSSGSYWFKVSNEYFMGFLLFVMLNLLLFFVNALDAYCLWIIQRVPGGLSVADYLHEGTNSLILSIVLAIAVILVVFRGYLNFIEKNKWLKILCYGWIAQNVFMLITTAHKNWWIIESSGLTRRRIGIYVYLLLCLIGLVMTYIKVADRKSNWFLFRKNAWAFYMVFIIACFFNWDNMIVRYNCTHFKALESAYIDRDYQAELSHTCLATLFQFYIDEQKENKPYHKIFTPEMVKEMYGCYNRLLREKDGTGWQSFSVSKMLNRDAVNEMIGYGKVSANP